MSSKVPEVIFTATATERSLHWHNNEDLVKYLTEHLGEDLFIHIRPVEQLSKKMKLYAYLHKVIYPCAVIAYTANGYPGFDNVKADYLLRAELAKDFIELPGGKYQVVMINKSDMTHTRLHKYISDCIYYLEENFGQQVPDSETYKLNKLTGHTFTKIDTHNEKRD